MDKSRLELLREAASILSIRVRDWEAFDTAFTHPTFVFENRHLGKEHNQRLEFLGDAVLGVIVAEHLFTFYPDKPEGELTKMRAGVVCESTLARKSLELDLGKYLRLGKGEELTGGRQRASILADVFEAVVGAIYLDAGLAEAKRMVLHLLQNDIENMAAGDYQDYKTLLQEVIQKDHDENVMYKILKETGPDHDKRFLAGVIFQGRLLAKGTGRSKKEAEQKAARLALEKLQKLR
ncbi:MAG TPA: ribonuclease III [Clostridia bacterium]|nr:ribonuclease III [Clostridia bacterium]